jgi:putative tryptophan/tyrosine transport system substrate-binding protein
VRRREFIKLVAGAAASLPLSARAQQANGMRRIAALMDTSENNAEGQARIAAFRQGLAQLGWVEGRNIQIDVRWAPATSSARATLLLRSFICRRT